jgi:hypothetical protein
MLDTCQQDTTLLVGLDDDDPAAGEYPAGPDYETLHGLRGFTACANALAVPRAEDYLYIGALGDDNVPETPGWDTEVIAALGRTPFAFGNDLYPLRPPGTQVTHVFMRSAVVQALGYLGVPALTHMYVDDAWGAWGRACGITFLSDVIIRHVHFTTGAAPMDDTYAAAQQTFGPGQHAFAAYCQSGLADDIKKIRSACAP